MRSDWGTRWADWCFRIDLRSLGLFRILLACLLIHDWFTRWPNLEAFYTLFGVLPVEAHTPATATEFRFSLLDAFGSTGAVRAFFLAGLVCYAALLVGWRSRLFLALSFLFFVSVVNRNTLVRAHSDVVLVVMMMWSIFLPVGRRFSLDARRDAPNRAGPHASEPSLAAFAILLQFGLIYFLTAFNKSGDTWRDGTALYHALHFDLLTTPPGLWLGEQPLGVIKALTWGTLVIEYLALPLLFVPSVAVRRVLILALTSLQAGIALTMDIGHFPFVMIALNTLLLTGKDWDPATPANHEPQRDPLPRGRRWLAVGRDVCVMLILIAVLVNAWNFATPRLGVAPVAEPTFLRAIIQGPQIVQDWYMFAPDPMKKSMWWHVHLRRASDPPGDPLGALVVAAEKPSDLARRYDRFWSYYFIRLCHEENEIYRRLFARYLFRKEAGEGNAASTLREVEFYTMEETHPPPGRGGPSTVEGFLRGRYRF